MAPLAVPSTSSFRPIHGGKWSSRPRCVHERGSVPRAAVIERATAARSAASSASVELTNTRKRWSGVRIAPPSSRSVVMCGSLREAIASWDGSWPAASAAQIGCAQNLWIKSPKFNTCEPIGGDWWTVVVSFVSDPWSEARSEHRESRRGFTETSDCDPFSWDFCPVASRRAPRDIAVRRALCWTRNSWRRTFVAFGA
jgi:hypothetical protein